MARRVAYLKPSTVGVAAELSQTDIHGMSEGKHYIIFLDIDGVLNSQGRKPGESCFKATCVNYLNEIILARDCRVVLSSSWRYMIFGENMTLQGFGWLLASHRIEMSLSASPALHYQRLIGTTPSDEKVNGRANQIIHWLEANQDIVKGFVILDDGNYAANESTAKHLVRTDAMIGLSSADVSNALACLELEPSWRR